jgi:sugar phosphate isomerase/epimerase
MWDMDNAAMWSRRSFLGASVLPLMAAQRTPLRIGVEMGCIGAAKFTPYQYLDFLARIGVQAAQFSASSLGVNPANPDESTLKKIREYATKRGITFPDISGRSICPTSSRFDSKSGTAEQQIAQGLKLARMLGATAMRVVVGGADERVEIEKHMASTAQVLKGMRSQIRDSGVKLAMENHGGDFQARELKALVEDVGSDILGVCLDSGNPLWMIEDPHLTLELLGPYAINSHIRDTAVWRVPEGVAVRWVNMGEGNVDIDGWTRKLVRMHPNLPVTLENIVSPQPRIIRVFDTATFKSYPKMPASDLSRFLALAERGKPVPAVPPVPGKTRGQQQCDDLEICVRYTRKLLDREGFPG